MGWWKFISKSSKSRGIAEKRIKEIFEKSTIVRLDVYLEKWWFIFSIWKNHKTAAYNPLPKESKAIFSPLFVKMLLCDRQNVKNKIFHGKLFELFGPKSILGKNWWDFFKKNIKSKVFLIKVLHYLLLCRHVF